MATKAELTFRELILTTGLLQPVEVGGKSGNVYALCRGVPGGDQAWLALVKSLLQTSEASDIDLHVCRQYVLKGKELVFGWHVAINSGSAKQLALDLEVLRTVFGSVKPSLLQREMPRKAVRVPSRREPEPAPGPAPEPPRQAVENDLDAPEVLGPVDYNRQGPGPHIRVAEQGYTEDGKYREVTIMPLPGVSSRDMNAPTRPGGAGVYKKEDKPVYMGS